MAQGRVPSAILKAPVFHCSAPRTKFVSGPGLLTRKIERGYELRVDL